MSETTDDPREAFRIQCIEELQTLAAAGALRIEAEEGVSCTPQELIGHIARDTEIGKDYLEMYMHGETGELDPGDETGENFGQDGDDYDMVFGLA